MKWKHVEFSELIRDGAFGPRFSSKSYADDGNIATLRTTDLSLDGTISYDTMPLASLDESKFAKHFLQVGDIVISRSGRIGTTAYFDGHPVPVLPGAFLLYFRFNDLSSPRFYTYWFNSPIGQQRIMSIARGAAQQNINLTNTLKLQVPNPPKAVQESVVEILSSYDDLIENNRRRIELLEQSARLLYKEWFVHLRFPGHEHVTITNGIPDGWERCLLGDVLTLQRGFDLPKRHRKEGSVPIYASSGINGYHSEAKVKAPGIVTGRSGSLGKVLFVPHDFWPLNTTLWVKEFKQVSALFTQHLLASLKLEQYNGGAAVPTLNRNDAHRIEVLRPSGTIGQLFDEFAEKQKSQVEILTQQNAKLTEARDLLLPRLMKGEIAV